MGLLATIQDVDLNVFRLIVVGGGGVYKMKLKVKVQHILILQFFTS